MAASGVAGEVAGRWRRMPPGNPHLPALFEFGHERL